jgi:uncharacterized protein YbaR (Trm112 family)
MKLNQKISEKKILILSIILFSAIISNIAVAQGYSGKWNRTSLQFTVSIGSWGKDCGVRPSSYSTSKIAEVEVMESNNNLYFSTGRLRTDRCNSPNPDLKKMKSSTVRGNWSMVCETPSTISKYEKIDYTLAGTTGKLIYNASSSFKWTLNNNFCQVTWKEKRVYERPSAKTEPANSSPILNIHKDLPINEDPVSNSPKKAPEILSTPATDCVSNGKPVRLVIFPQAPIVQPSEKLCFLIQGIDVNGCRFPFHADWSISQNGITRTDLINKNCFIAGNNAAESEGVYDVQAKYGKISSFTTIEVAFPDMEDLARARLDIPSELIDEQPETETDADSDSVEKTEPTGSATVINTLKILPEQKTENPKSYLTTLFIVIVIALTGVLIFIIFFLKQKKKNTKNVSEDKPDNNMYCPTCNRIFDKDALFCPHDADKLKPVFQAKNSINNSSKGMICPKCHRGYDRDALFCPHDRNKLVKYSEWKNREH